MTGEVRGLRVKYFRHENAFLHSTSSLAMFMILPLLSLSALVFRSALSSSVPFELSIQSARRSETGPEIGGANFPDPSIIQVGGIWYAFATRTIGSLIKIQVASSLNFIEWSIVKYANGSQVDALPTLPEWVDQNSWNTWAPHVNQLDDGSFIMYYSASAAADPSKHCIGAAKATTITSPYTPIGSAALICPLSQGGAIDASGYNDHGKRYIIYKIDGNSLGHGGPCNNLVAPYAQTPLILQPVKSDGMTFTGTSTTILDNNGANDQGVIEGPSLVRYAYTYVLFFSSGCFISTYNQSYATATSITGPYTRAPMPLFHSGVDGLTNPGGGDIHTDGKHFVFHAKYGGGRAMYQAIVRIYRRTVTA